MWQIPVARVVLGIFGSAGAGLFGNRQGTPWQRNRLFGPIVQEMGIRQGTIDPNTPNLPWARPVSALPVVLNPPPPRAGSNRLPVPTAPPPGKYPSTTVYYPPPPPPQPPPPPPGQPPPYQPGGTPPLNPNAPNPNVPVTVTQSWPQFVLTQSMPYIIAGGRYAWDYYRSGQRPYETSGPRRRYRNRRVDSRPARTPPGQGDPFPPKPPRSTAGRTDADVKRDRMAGLDAYFYVPTARERIPKAPRPSPPPKPPAAPVPLWRQLLPIAGPALLGFLQPGQGNRTVVRLTDPLTRPQPDSPGQPGTQPGGGDPFPLTSPQTLVQSFGAFGGSGEVGTNTCECKAPRKKGRKKKRTVCYSGTFIERRDGTRKIKKRKVQCL